MAKAPAKRVCDAAALGARLESGEGVAGLREWIGQLRGAIVDDSRTQAVVKIGVAGLGNFSVLPRGDHRAVVRELGFIARQTLKNRANRHPLGDPEACDEVVRAIYGAVGDGFDAIVLPTLGTLRIEHVPAFTGSDFNDKPVKHGEKWLVRFEFDPKLAAAVAPMPSRS